MIFKSKDSNKLTGFSTVATDIKSAAQTAQQSKGVFQEFSNAMSYAQTSKDILDQRSKNLKGTMTYMQALRNTPLSTEQINQLDVDPGMKSIMQKANGSSIMKEARQYLSIQKSMANSFQETAASATTVSASFNTIGNSAASAAGSLKAAGSGAALTSSSFEAVGTSAASAAIKTGLLNAALSVGIMLAISLAIEAIKAIVQAIENWCHRIDIQKEKVAEATQAYQDATTQLSDLNTELENTQNRIDELESKSTLTLVEEDELKQLREATQELALQKEIAEERANMARDTAARENIKLFEMQYPAQEISEEAVQRKVNQGSPVSTKASNEHDVISLLAAYRQYTNLMADSTANTEGFNEQLVEVKENLFDNLESLEGMKDAIEAIPEAERNAKLGENWRENLNSINTARDLIYKELMPDQWAKVKMADIFQMEGMDEVQEKLLEIFQNGDYTSDVLSQFSDLQSLMDESGLSADNLLTYLDEISRKDLGIDQYEDLSTILNDLSSGTELLSKAQEELANNGSLSSETIGALSEKYSDLEGPLTEYLLGLKSEGEIQELLKQKSDEANTKYIEGLRSRILNQNESVKQFALAYGVDLDNFNEAERQKLTFTIDSRAAELGITQENIKNLAEEYGVDLSNYATKEAKKVAVSNAVLRSKISKINTNLSIGNFNSEDERKSMMDEKKNLERQLVDEKVVNGVLNSLDLSLGYTPKNPTSNSSTFGSNSLSSTSQPTVSDEFTEGKAEADDQRARDLIDEQEYYDKRLALYEKYVKGKSELGDLEKSELKELDGLKKSLNQDIIDSYDDQIDKLKDVEGSEDERYRLVQEKKAAIEKIMAEAREAGKSETSEYYKSLISMLEDTVEQEKDILEEKRENEQKAFLEDIDASKDRIASYKDRDQGEISGELMVEEADAAMKAINDRIEKLRGEDSEANKEYIKELQKQYQELYDSRLEGLQMILDAEKKQIDESISAAREALEKERKATEEFHNEEIKAYKRKHEAQEKVNTLKEKELQLENLKKQRNVLTYMEGRGFVYTADTEAVDAAQEDLDKTREEYEYQAQLQRMEDAKEKALKAIDDELAKLNEQQEFWDRYFEDFDLNSKTAQDIHEDWVKKQGEKFVEQTQAVTNYADTYTAQLERMIEKIRELNALESGRELKGELKSGASSGKGKGYASGSAYVSNSGTYLVNENGPEAIFKPGTGTYEYLPQGTVVFSAAATKNLWNWSKLSPAHAFRSSHLPSIAVPQVNSINIGDVILNGVQDTDRLSREIVDRLPLALQQEFYKR